jgi:hypothetical protein
MYSVSYIESHKRNNFAIHWLLFFLTNFNNYKLNNRIFLLFTDLLFNFKNSIIYKRKIQMYKKVFKL